MKKKLGAILLVVALVLALALPAAPAAAHTEAFPKTVDLIADGGSEATEIVVGSVSVWNDEVNLYVKYQTTDGWEMTATHLEVALSEPEIPQNKKGNPKVGHFSRNEPHDPPVTEWEEVFNLADKGWAPCNGLVIAAQADVQKLSDVITATLVTGAGTDNVVVIAEDPLNLGYPVVPPYGTPVPAVLTWVHGSWPSIAGAQWISSALYVENPPPNSWRLFTRNFSVPSNAVNLSGTLQITADNAEEVELNGTPVGIDGEVYGPFIDNHEWATILSHAVSPQPETNTLEVMVRNYAGSSSATGNPTGLIYKMDYEYQLLRTETAWGDGDRFTEPGNWAMYFDYHVQGPVLDWDGDDSSAVWDTVQYHHGTQSAKLSIPVDYTINSYARVTMSLVCQDVTLDDITSLSYWYYVDPSTAITPGSTSVPGVYDGFIKTEAWAEPSGGGYADYDTYGGPYLIIELDADLDGNADTWVIQAKWASDTRGSWVQDDIETTEPFHVVCLLGLTPSFSIGTNWGSLTEVKAAVPGSGEPTLGDAEVTAIKIAIGWWNPAGPTAPVGPVTVNVDEVEVNGLLLF